MKKIVRLSESELVHLIKMVIKEQPKGNGIMSKDVTGAKKVSGNIEAKASTPSNVWDELRKYGASKTNDGFNAEEKFKGKNVYFPWEYNFCGLDMNDAIQKMKSSPTNKGLDYNKILSGFPNERSGFVACANIVNPKSDYKTCCWLALFK